MIPANYYTDPKEVKTYDTPRFHFIIRFDGWMLTKKGLFRWGRFDAAVPMRDGSRAKRFGWVKIFPTNVKR